LSVLTNDLTGILQPYARRRNDMGRTLDEVMAGLPEDRRKAVEARTEELLREVEGLRALRALAERSQEQIAEGLGIKQPSVHKIERQADLYLSTLRRFVEAAGGTLELRVDLPGKGTIRLTGIGDLHS
jgi:DNA-directed RNA polymerase specialized sigma24 family protein